MTFFVRKKLALGPIRFGVSPRLTADAIDDDPSFSTGPNGEFTRRSGKSGYFFGDIARFQEPSLPTPPSITTTPFWSSLKPDGTPRSYGFVALMAFGALFFLLGLAVLARKGPQGWIEILLGIAMIATPIVLTAQERKAIREKEEKERAEREATEKRNRELLAAYTAALDRLRRDRDSASLENLDRERKALTLPYDIWGAAARRAILLIGFDELGKRGIDGAPAVARLMTDASKAAGLTPDDETGAKLDLYRTIVWHLLADDRLGTAQEGSLLALRKAFNIWERDVPAEAAAEEQFRRLRGITVRNLPRTQSGSRLAFQEYAILDAKGNVIRKKNASDETTLTVTNRRLIVASKKPTEVPLPQVNDVDVDADENVMSIDTAVTKQPIELRVKEPIYDAAIVDMAAGLVERPPWQ